MKPDVAFLVGAPRSGTTWLQQMLGAHPDVVTTQETDLFDGYLAPWYSRWADQLPHSEEEWRANRFKGLPAVLDEDELDELARSVIDRVHEATLALKPGATLVLEKVPGYAVHAELLHRIVPDAAFVHLIRDGRDAVASMQQAARGWGRHAWRTSSAGVAAAVWYRHVAGARALRATGSRYTELRYEDLRGDRGPALLASLFAELGLPGGLALAADIYERFAIDRSRDPETAPSSFAWGGEVARRLQVRPVEPAGFVGDGATGGWHERLTTYEQEVVDRTAGPLLVELGYAEPGWVEGSALRRRGASCALWARRRLEPLDYHLRRRRPA